MELSVVTDLDYDAIGSKPRHVHSSPGCGLVKDQHVVHIMACSSFYNMLGDIYDTRSPEVIKFRVKDESKPQINKATDLGIDTGKNESSSFSYSLPPELSTSGHLFALKHSIEQPRLFIQHSVLQDFRFHVYRAQSWAVNHALQCCA